MRKRLFVLNSDLSGINAFLFEGLRRAGWHLQVQDVGFPARVRYAAAARTFACNRVEWKRRYHAALAGLARSPDGLRQRTELCSQLLARHARVDDVVLTFGTQFAPEHLRCERPYVVFKDYTMALARRGASPGMPAAGADLERWTRQERTVCRRAAFVFTASRNTRRSVIEDYGVASGRVVCVGEGVCMTSLPQLRRDTRASNEVLFVGRDFRRKGGGTLLAAFDQVRRRRRARLTIVGPSAPPAPSAGVLWAGRVDDRARLGALYDGAQLFVMPSEREPFGLVFLEAMAHGLPCIGCKRDAMPEIIEDGVTGFLIEPRDVPALRDRICALLDHPQRARDMGRRGYERVVTRFLWSQVAARMDTHLTALVTGLGAADGAVPP